MNNFKWTPRKRRAAFLLATEPMTYREVAAKLNITEQTLWNYRQSPHFQREVTRMSNQENRLRTEANIAVSMKTLMRKRL